MKRSLIFLLAARFATAAFSASTQWDVRTTGNDGNGGGFQSGATGTDYSQQNSPQFTYTDLVIDATTNTKITSAAHPFDSTSPGNIINITAGTGFTVQRVQIVSVAGNVATCDRAVGTTSSTGGQGVLGGALATPITAINLAVSSNTVHVKAGTYTQSANSTMNGNASPLYVYGYQTTHRDGGTHPLLTTATNGVDIFRCEVVSAGELVFDNIDFSSTASSRGHGLIAWTGAVQLVVRNSVMDGFKNGISGDLFGDANAGFSNIVLTNVEIKNSTSHGIVNAGTVYVYGSKIHNSTGSGIVAGNASSGIPNIAVHSSIYSNGAVGLAGYSTGNAAQVDSWHVFDSTIYNNTSDGILCGIAGQVSLSLVNNIIYGNGGWGVNLLSAAAEPAINSNNAYGSNTSGNRNNFSAGPSDLALTVSPFTSTTDLSPNNTSGGGALARAAGFPAYLDVGALQHACGASAVPICSIGN